MNETMQDHVQTNHLFVDLLLKIISLGVFGEIGWHNIGVGDQICRVLVPNIEQIRATTNSPTKKVEARIDITRDRHLGLWSWHKFRCLGIESEWYTACFFHFHFLFCTILDFLRLCLCHFLLCVIFSPLIQRFVFQSLFYSLSLPWSFVTVCTFWHRCHFSRQYTGASMFQRGDCFITHDRCLWVWVLTGFLRLGFACKTKRLVFALSPLKSCDGHFGQPNYVTYISLGQDITCLTSVQSVDLRGSNILKDSYDPMIQLLILTTINSAPDSDNHELHRIIL